MNSPTVPRHPSPPDRYNSTYIYSVSRFSTSCCCSGVRPVDYPRNDDAFEARHESVYRFPACSLTLPTKHPLPPIPPRTIVLWHICVIRFSPGCSCVSFCIPRTTSECVRHHKMRNNEFLNSSPVPLHQTHRQTVAM